MTIHGFEMAGARRLDLLGVEARRLVHGSSGAEVLVLAGDEPNLSFAVGFATYPTDDTGVAHILEHIVLAGSKRFPLKDPFFDMIKGSLAGFLNAMTYPDRTVYPFATQDPKDFDNLLQVYLDAVFAPLLLRDTFAQEAWHLEPAGDDGALAFRGVVYNEMKGAMADPNRALQHLTTTRLFPNSPYRFESGGDPAAIPDLTYEELVAFHAEYYHPSRARFVLHGAVDVEAALLRIADYVDGVAPIAAVRLPDLEPSATEPVVADTTYPADASGKALAAVTWALPPVASPFDDMRYALVDHVLIGTPSAPMRRALLDAGLGEAFVGGLQTSIRQTTLSAGLRGVDPERARDVHALVLETVARVVADGIDEADVTGWRNRTEFEVRELDVYGGQRGVALALDALGGWLHGRDPIDELDVDATLAAIDAWLGGGPQAITDFIREVTIGHQHRVDATVLPDPSWSARRDEEERARLDAHAAQMTDEDRALLALAAERLLERQRTPDGPDAKASLPSLQRSDLRDLAVDPVVETSPLGPASWAWIEQPTRGIVYLDLAFDLRGVPERLLGSVAVLGRLLLETGTERRSLADLTRAIDRDTGGIGSDVELSAGLGGTDGMARFVVSGSSLASNVERLADLIVEVVREARFDDRDTVRRLVVESVARRRAGLERAGHRYALQRVAATASLEESVDEQMTGLGSLHTTDAWIRRCDDDWEGVRADLEALRHHLLHASGLVVGVVSDADSKDAASAAAARLVEALPPGSMDRERWEAHTPGTTEGWILPGQVNYVGSGRILDGGAPLPGSWLVPARWLSSDVMIPRIRFEGGAYGAGTMIDPLRGAIRSFSYRDPNLERTLATIDEAPTLLREAAGTLADDDIDTLVIGAVGRLDPYVLPGARGYRALMRTLRGTNGQVERLRRDILATTRDAFVELAEAFERAGDPHVTVLGPRSALERMAATSEVTIYDPAPIGDGTSTREDRSSVS